jgi:hypothetical protein
MRGIYEELEAIYKAKNADYGDSFGKSIAEWGIIAGVVRMDDKMRRLKNLVKQDALVKDETIRDTLLDLANYAIMTLEAMDTADYDVEVLR